MSLSSPASATRPGGAPELGAGPVPAVETRKLTKSYGARRAIRNLDCSLAPGRRLAVLGPNGAGKSTLIRLLALLTRPTSGSLSIYGHDTYGHDAIDDAADVRRLLGVVLHDSLLYPDLTVAENLAFAARLYSVQRPMDRVAALIDHVALGRLAGTRVRQLSRGQRQRACIARALVHDPPLLLLDEPDTGLDARSLEQIWEQLRADPQRTLVFSTHDSGHALGLATDLMLLYEGRPAFLGPAEDWTPARLAGVLLAAGGYRPEP